MPDSIVSILGGLRRRLVAARAAEAAAVAGAAGGLTAACLMAGWILAGPLPPAGAALCMAPLAAGVAILLAGRVRLNLDGPLRWFCGLLAIVGGGAGAALILTGLYAAIPKNALFLILPVAALSAGVAAVARGLPLGRVARWLDHRAALRERLSTALEVASGGQASAFAQTVRRQALAAAQGPAVRAVEFWTRTRATVGAVGLAVVAAALMLPWEPLATPEQRLARAWERAAPTAAETIDRQLGGLDPAVLAANPRLAENIRRLEELAAALRSAKPADAAQWQGKAVELSRLTDALRQAARSGQLDPAVARQVEQLARTLEQVAAELAAGMGEEPPREYARTGAARPTTTGESAAPPAGQAVTVYDPNYAKLVTSQGTSGAATAGGSLVPYDKAWAEARRRAAQGLSARTIPPEYRQLVRDFFEAQ